MSAPVGEPPSQPDEQLGPGAPLQPAARSHVNGGMQIKRLVGFPCDIVTFGQFVVAFSLACGEHADAMSSR